MDRRLVVVSGLLVACHSESAAPSEAADARDAPVVETAIESDAADSADVADVCSKAPPSLPCCEGAFYTGPTYTCLTCASLTRDVAQCRSGAWSWAVNDDCWFACRDAGPADASDTD